MDKDYKGYQGSGDGHPAGVHSSQPEGRMGLPPVDNNVGEAKEDKGATLRCVKKQVGENRYPINSHVEEKKEYGSNN